ncbi:MAG: cysteine desulfurase family protein [Ardenticatenales bacterium]
MPATDRFIYLDNSATTPVAPDVVEAMIPFYTTFFGNASGAYSLARKSRGALEHARSTVACVLGCRPQEVIFTSGGSESDNLALRGVAHAWRAAGRAGGHIITSAIEHEAVLATAHDLARDGFAVTIVGVDADGRVRVDDVLAAVRPDTCLVSVMLANNEVGTLQPVAEIGAALRPRGIAVHTDAVQAAAWLDVDVNALNVDLMSLSAHKFYGPKGVGVLYVRDGTPVEPVQTGGGQEGHRRAGTENVAGAVGLACALQRAADDRAMIVPRLTMLRDRLIDTLTADRAIQLTGHRTMRMPNHVSLCVCDVRADVLLLGLDMRGICASSGSACSSGKVDPSHVLSAMGVPAEVASGALRFSLGRHTTDEDIEHVLAVLPPLVEALRSVGAVRRG